MTLDEDKAQRVVKLMEPCDQLLSMTDNELARHVEAKGPELMRECRWVLAEARDHVADQHRRLAAALARLEQHEADRGSA